MVDQATKSSGPGHPPCAVCGGPVPRRPGERPSKHSRRKSCSPACANALLSHGKAGRPRLPAYRHPPCENCGGHVARHGSETRERWIARRYCSVACRKEAGEIDPGWPEITGSTLRGTPFAEHTINPGDGGPLRVQRPETWVASATVLGGN